MRNAYVVTGTLTDAQTVMLDEALPLRPTRVRLVVEPFAPAAFRSFPDVMAEIRQRQQARGHKPRSADEVARYLQVERDNWEQ